MSTIETGPLTPDGAGIPFRPLRFGVTRSKVRDGANGTRYLRAELPLQTYPQRLTDRLRQWAEQRPGRTLFARRRRVGTRDDGTPVLGDWQTVTYGDAWQAAQAIAQALLTRHLSAERPVLVLADNSLEHALLSLGCLVAGVPWAPVSPAYALLSRDYCKLRHIAQTVTPGLIFAQDERYAAAVEAVIPPDVEVVLGEGTLPRHPATPWAALTTTTPTEAVEAALEAIGPDTIVKFLFTSGSTQAPKAVINTHRMWCANQQQMAQSMPVFTEEDLVLVDWLPWNHTFGGNHNFGMILYHGGTLYIDDGKPTPTLIGETLRNLREIAPTVYFNVPTGFEAIAHAMEHDARLRATLLARLRMFFYAGASMAQPIWNSLWRSCARELGVRVPITTGLGMTETGPFALFVPGPEVRAGDLGLPAPGLEVKLAPVDDKIEVRYRGPNVTPGYWRNAAQTAAAFDEEGFFRSGDAVTWIDPTDAHRGVRFDGRIAEDFKLATGTFVSVGPLRARLIAAGAPYVQDAVITGLNHNEIGAMVFPTLRVRELCPLPADAPLHDVVEHPAVLAHFQRVLDELARESTGSANRIARLILLADQPSIDRGEITDKGSINQRAVLAHRADTVEALYAGTLRHILQPTH
jgi:feruloyl-CoA synthase